MFLLGAGVDMISAKALVIGVVIPCMGRYATIMATKSSGKK